MKDKLQTMNIRKFTTLFPDYMDIQMGDDFFVADFDLEPSQRLMEHPCRVDGYVAIFCIKGNLDLEINLDTFTVGKNTLLINIPGNIFRIARHSTEAVHLLVVAMSKDFFSSMNVDFNKLFNESMALLSDPCVVLQNREVLLLKQYMSLGTNLVKAGLSNTKEVIGSLISSVFYLFSSIWSKHIKEASAKKHNVSSRANMIFEEFLQLVKEYHYTQRGVGFYSDRLFLTPKYLSKIVKSVSGVSAPDWINSFVILEAKNMLKYSDLTISEIVYRLNFSSQSVFYKFFKGQTGMTPSEYRKM